LAAGAAPLAAPRALTGSAPAAGDADHGGPGPRAHARRPADRPIAAPAVRAFAASHRVDLALLTGSGLDGEITRADVERAASALGTGSMVPLTGVRRAMAVRMADAGAEVVSATLTEEADVTAWSKDTPITARLMLALAAGCAAEPALNASLDGLAMTRRLNAAVHVGLAVDTPDGLFVPVLRDVATMDAETISARLEILLEAVSARTIAPDAMRGATISLSNFGSLGGLFASLVVVPPQVAILGAGRIHDRIVPGGNGFRARRMLPLSLSFDHRAVTGGEAARFLAAVAAHLSTAS
jgi:2-oxoisovalerate dehydrogenase E2 component (dihydrolipoyl transacylase)